MKQDYLQSLPLSSCPACPWWGVGVEVGVGQAVQQGTNKKTESLHSKSDSRLLVLGASAKADV